MSPTDLLIPTYRNMLRTLLGLLATVDRQMPDRAESLLAARLSPDMYPLAAQLRFAAYQAQEATLRMRGIDIPDTLAAVAAEGRDASDNPGTIAAVRGRIEDALAALDALDGDALDTGATDPITLVLPNDLIFDMTADDFARDWALPQFYFHVVTAYAILRHHGVTIGKADYVPHMFAYLRSEPTA